jgi:hypothetical protein
MMLVQKLHAQRLRERNAGSISRHTTRVKSCLLIGGWNCIEMKRKPAHYSARLRKHWARH